MAHDESNSPLYEVEFIVGHSTLPGTKHTSLYVKYKGYNVPEWNDLKNVQHHMGYFWIKVFSLISLQDLH